MKKEITKEMIEYFESQTGAKVLDVEEMIIEYEGKKMRPVKDQSEFMCLCFDNEPVLFLRDCTFVSVDYKP